MDINTLIDYLAYFAWIVDAGGVIASAILIAMGREEGKKILFGTVAGAFVLAFFWTILTTTITPQSVNLPYWNYIEEFTYAGAAVAMIFAAIEMIRGELKEGLGYLLAAILIVFMVNYGPQILGVQSLNLQPANVNAEIGGVGVAGFNFGGVPLSWLIEMPDPSSFSAFQSVFQLSQEVALGILGIAFVFALIIRTYELEDPITALKQTSKDTITAAILIYGIVDLYNIFAQVINYAATNIVAPYQGTLETMDNIVTGIIIGGFAGGYFVPALADIASDLLFSLFLAAMLALIRFLAIAAALAVAPILISLWIVPPMRGVIRFIGDVIIGLGISGLISSVILALLSSFINQYPEILIASPVLFGFLPMMIGFGTATGLLPVGAGNLIPFKRGGKKGSQGQTAQTQTQAGSIVAPGGVVASQTVGQTKLRNQRVSSTVSNPPPAPVGIAGRLRNRKTVTITSNPRDNWALPEKLPGGLKKEADYIGPVDPQKVKQYGEEMKWVASSAPPIPGIYEEIKKYGETRARELGISPEQRGRVVRYRETIPHALVRGVADNLKAGLVMTAEKFGQKMDDWLNQQGVSIRPFESIENKIREVKLKKSKKD
ncbi:hypothetical protein [Sulfolobus acidocaldarius]|uniref:hypothetical protein n=1 Tax=Sulfolobus acidocaldarius TaxID=2285 RepID=UPI000B5A94C0|nr:hypothetical protein [Sulfolobus acidocaldarius]